MGNKIKFGKVVIIGRPNTGKSTLINTIMQQKVSITSPLPQTTRKTNRVIYSSEKGKILFSDTPGIMGKVADLAAKKTNQEAPSELNGAEVIICLVDLSRPKSDEENKVIGLIRKIKAKKILVYNKIDKLNPNVDHLPEYNYLEEEFDYVTKISALKDKFVKGLIKQIFEYLPEVEEERVRQETGEDEVRPLITMSSKEYIEEIIREKAYLFLREEVPYSIIVEVLSIKEKKQMLVIKALIKTKEERYKKMIIGKNGQKIKEIGYNARKELELMSGRKIYLEMEVVTDKHWMERL